ncbi:Cys-rich peptide radical SAM maturase CcpM [Clostridium gasigenes]|uniref:Cys-rich peptide radical SAM maturase CcpM n=1 Tax=Clostridium gasigenes TaxID=94869 RepID=UPI001C0AC146|nr:Cys-rich peptide radical SAM maturase CcpM [Clostridium gasigenes]MBU3107438.1 Cys-rich peptide radical SAM maturase CcpM [Clostridium gasigenes]
MLNNKPLIKLFKTRAKSYMYDANKNSVLNISDKQYSFLENCMESNVDDYIKAEETNKLYKEGFLSSNRVKEIVHPEDELLSFHLENNVKMLTLQVTQQCNFRCEYCIFSGEYLNRNHSNKKMSISRALKGIDFLINHSKNHNKIIVAFYGGEPLLEFNFIRQCIEYAEKKAEGKEVRFSMTTNGSLLTDEIVEFLYKHNVMLTISLDGPREVHDIHRKFASSNCGSFDKVINNIINIEKKFPDYVKKIRFNAVIDAKNDFSCIDKFFLNYESIKDMILTSGLISDKYKKIDAEIYEDYFLKREYEFFRILYCFIRKKDNKNCSKIVMPEYDDLLQFSEQLIPTKILPKKTHPSGPCIPGVQRLFMNADGFFFPCEKVSESSELTQIGHIDTGFNINKVRNILNIGKVNEGACKNCWAIRLCSICVAALDSTEKEVSRKKREEFCKSVKINVEEKLKNYCVLKEFGHSFESNEQITLFND